jgi:hypothetical protein
MIWLKCLALAVCFLNPILLFGQYSNSNLVGLESKNADLSASSDQVSLAEYCNRELFNKFKDRPYHISNLADQGQSFEIWADSLSRRFLVFIDIPEEGWVTEHLLSLPLILNRYQKNYMLEAFVKVYRKNVDKPSLVKKYSVKISGRKAYQVWQNNPNDSGLIIPFKERLFKERQAHMRLASLLAKDIYVIIDKTNGKTTEDSNVPKG